MKISCVLIVALVAVCHAKPPVNILPPDSASEALYGAASAPQYNYGESSDNGGPKPYVYEPPSNQYLPAFQRSSIGEKQIDPNYKFAYTVKDKKSGNNYGHTESKQGKTVTGQYFVLLPDGRKQIVTYEADENGYRPKVRYEQR